MLGFEILELFYCGVKHGTATCHCLTTIASAVTDATWYDCWYMPLSQYLFGLQEAIPQDDLDHLITSMLRRVGMVTEKHGGHTRYIDMRYKSISCIQARKGIIKEIN